MGKWGQSPTYTVSHDPQEIERSPFRVSEVEEPKQVPCKRFFLGGGEECQESACLDTCGRFLGIKCGGRIYSAHAAQSSRDLILLDRHLCQNHSFVYSHR